MWLLHLVVFILPDVVYGNSEIFITPSNNITCPAHPCITLNKYANELDLYLMNDSTVRFLPGYHCLDNVLILRNLSNIKFTAITDEDNNSVHVLVGPSACLMWINSHNIKIDGFVFVLVGDPGMKHGYSALLFQRMISVLLSNSIILGNNKFRYSAVFLNDSRDVIVSSMKTVKVTSYKGAAVHAVNSIIEFIGQNIFNSNIATNSGGAIVFDSCIISVVGTLSFINNTSVECGGALLLADSTCYVFGNASFISNSAPIHGGAIMLNKSDWYYYGNALFINNSVSVQNESSLSNLVGGGAVYCANSMLFFYGYTLFQYNCATAPLDVHSPIQA